MKRTVSIFVLLTLVSAVAFAHGNEEHIMGTITKISDHSITVETPAKAVKTVEFTKATKFVRSGKPASVNDLKVGDRVVIHAVKNGNRLEAITIRFGAAHPGAGQKKRKEPLVRVQPPPPLSLHARDLRRQPAAAWA